MNRSCLNCKHGDWQETHVPCEFCGPKGNWTPKPFPKPKPKPEPKYPRLSCQDCKHCHFRPDEAPCLLCCNYSLFEKEE